MSALRADVSLSANRDGRTDGLVGADQRPSRVYWRKFASRVGETIDPLKDFAQKERCMPRELRLDADAPWKRRYRLPVTSIIQIAPAMPGRGLAASNRSGTFQLYAWHVLAGEFRQLTERAEGVARGVLSPDGAYVYYLLDRKGD